MTADSGFIYRHRPDGTDRDGGNWLRFGPHHKSCNETPFVSLMSKDDEAIEDMEADRAYGKEVESSALFGMVLQESPPCLGRRFRVFSQVLGHCGISYFKAEQCQF